MTVDSHLSGRYESGQQIGSSSSSSSSGSGRQGECLKHILLSSIDDYNGYDIVIVKYSSDRGWRSLSVELQ